MNKGLIADIERASTHDGYGMRTVVFFKGCPLSCLWCHNPECISPEKELMYYPEKCIHCGMCEHVCPVGNILRPEGKPVWQHNCTECLACLHICPQHAINKGPKTEKRHRYRHKVIQPKELLMSRNVEE